MRPAEPVRDQLLIGVDFTSAPRRAKPITAAFGRIELDACAAPSLRLLALECCADWPAFEALLQRRGPWLGAFDFPFGLPRAAVVDLGWPQHWPALVRHCAALGRAAFRDALDADRATRPPGQRYVHRATDHPARSHSPLKLVNPPVGLMFLEGAPRLLAAGVHLPGIHDGDTARIALEAYPALLARRFARGSYKSEARGQQDDARRARRARILAALLAGAAAPCPPLRAEPGQVRELLDDARADRLDAVLALCQAAAGALHGPPRHGLPAAFDSLEGWIAGA